MSVRHSQGVCGLCFTAVQGALYAWGANNKGQLGLGEPGPCVDRPQLVGEHAVAAVAAGKGHSAFVTTAGSVFTFGWNKCGQLGTRRTPRAARCDRQAAPHHMGIARVCHRRGWAHR